MAVIEFNIVGQSLAATLEERVRLRECSGFFIPEIHCFYIKEEMKMYLVTIEAKDDKEDMIFLKFNTFEVAVSFIQTAMTHQIDSYSYSIEEVEKDGK